MIAISLDAHPKSTAEEAEDFFIQPNPDGISSWWLMVI